MTAYPQREALFDKLSVCLLVVVLSWGAAVCMVACQGGCGGATQALKTEVRNLQGCDTADAQAIIVASAAIVATVAEVKAGGDRVSGMLKVVESMTVIRERWRHCKATAAEARASPVALFGTARASPVALFGTDDDIDASTLGVLFGQ